MADLPKILARPNIAEVGLPRTNAQAFGAGLFGTLAEVTAAMQEKQKPIDAAKQASEYEIAIEDLKNEIQSEPDPNKWRDVFVGREAELRQKMLGAMTDSGVKEAFTLHVNRNLGRHVIDLNDKSIKASHQKQLGDIETVGKTLARQAAEAQYEWLRSSYLNTYNAMINAAATPTAIGGRAVPAAITPKEAEAKKQKFGEMVEKSRAYFRIETDPEGLKTALQKGEYPSLSGPEREALKNHAEASIDRRIRLSKQAEADRVDALNTALLNANVSGQLKIGDVMLMPDEQLPFKDKRFWVDRLTQQAKADGKEDNPFEKSDGATRARVLSGVLTRPGEWTTEKILSFMGQGLSVTHANQLVNMHQDLIKPKAAGSDPFKKYDPLNSTLATLDGLRRSYAFTKEGQNQKVSDANAAAALRLKNDEEYQKVADRIIQRAQMGENPRAVLQQEMKPYFDQKTKDWMDDILNWFTAPLQATDKKIAPSSSPAVKAEEKRQLERLNNLDQSMQRYREALSKTDDDEAARAFLERHGKAITPDTIKRTKEHLKKRAGAATEY